jgi:hypothetical protein
LLKHHEEIILSVNQLFLCSKLFFTHYNSTQSINTCEITLFLIGVSETTHTRHDTENIVIGGEHKNIMRSD